MNWSKTVHNLSKIHTSPKPQLFLPLIILFCYVLNHIASIPLWCTCSINMSWKFAVSVSILGLTYVIWNFSLYTNLAFLGKIAINFSYFMKSTLNPMTDTSDLHQLVSYINTFLSSHVILINLPFTYAVQSLRDDVHRTYKIHSLAGPLCFNFHPFV